MKDPNLSSTPDLDVEQSVYNVSQGIRDFILTQKVFHSHPVDLLETLYNNANRLVTEYQANTLSTFLATFTLRFHHWLFRIILQNHNVFGANNNAMVSSIETLYTNNTINLSISMFKNRYFPLLFNLKSDDNTFTFPTASGANIDSKTNSYKLTDTQGWLQVDLTDYVSNGHLLNGFTLSLIHI